MPKKLKFGNTIICEYVAKGDRNKHILVNVFSGDIMVGSFPALIQLALYIEHISDRVGDQSIVLRLCQDDNEFAKIEAHATTDQPGNVVNLIIQSLAVSIEKAMTFEVRASAEGYATTKVITKKIFLGDVPS